MAAASERLCEKALEENEERLSRLPNVVGLGIVARHEDEPDGKQLAVGVYVTRKQPAEALRRADRIPSRLRVETGETYRLVPVRVIEQGDVALESGDVVLESGDVRSEPGDGRSEPTLGKESP